MLSDYHMHCKPYSPDAGDYMDEMAQGALRRGMTHICITNHVENCTQSPEFPDQFPPFGDWGWEHLWMTYAGVREKYAGRLDIRLGAEVGSPHYLPEEGLDIYARPELEFVIGSVHNLRHAKDFYYLNYPEDFDNFRPAVEQYLDEYIELAGSGLCDVLGHIGYMQKYMARQGKGFDMMLFEERLRILFKTCVEHGVGIEVNTAALSDTLGDFLPQPSVVKLYRDMGGEIVTVGSDAHRAEDAGSGIREGFELLRTCGFKYVCLYEEHVPKFVKI